MHGYSQFTFFSFILSRAKNQKIVLPTFMLGPNTWINLIKIPKDMPKGQGNQGSLIENLVTGNSILYQISKTSHHSYISPNEELRPL